MMNFLSVKTGENEDDACKQENRQGRKREEGSQQSQAHKSDPSGGIKQCAQYAGSEQGRSNCDHWGSLYWGEKQDVGRHTVGIAVLGKDKWEKSLCFKAYANPASTHHRTSTRCVAFKPSWRWISMPTS
jgi:hypothetical protein